LINGDAVLSNSSMEQHTSENIHNMVNTEVVYRPHRKLSRGDEVYMVEQEYKTVTERKFISLLAIRGVLKSLPNTWLCSKSYSKSSF
jgi:hypothetical protein